MNWFLNLPIRAKLFLVFGFLVALFATALGVAYTSVNDLLSVQADLRAKQANVSDFSKVEANHNEGRVNVLMLFVTTDKAEQARWIAAVRKEHAENRENLTRIEARNAANPLVASKLRDYLAMREAYAAARERVFELVLSGNIEEGRRISLNENNDRYLAMRTMTNEFIRDSDADATATVAQAKLLSDAARQKFIVLGLAVLAGSFFGIFVLGRLIVDPVQALVAAARRVSAGDLRTAVETPRRHDEVGVLADSFGTMLQNFRTVHGEIQDSVNVIASAASEISTATAEMAATATETATAVSQTSTTVEQVKQTAQVSAQKAGHVADVAQKAAQSAQAGRKAVDESVGGMQNIREQMELIADTIVRLSEQSQAIGEIISSVNDLAEQSNLLAVNASIEAAKAGEHGRGFAVVAQEIRSLASQSKESTAQIRTILNDIQKATTAAVMAAEQGSKAVDAGFKQVSQSGESIRALTETIVTAAQAATQITASSQQQLIGVDQVAVAMQSILQASKQNASGTQQAESGARNLSDLGQKLKHLTQRFSL